MKKLLLEIKDLKVTEGSQDVLQGVNLLLDTQEVMSVIGANGAGKGHFINALMGTHPGKVTGQISLMSEAKIGLVSPRYTCADDLSIFENLSLTLKLMGVHSRAFLGEEVEEVLRDVELWSAVKGSLHEQVKHLDDFQKMRLNLARTLLLKPCLLLLDKSTQNIDPIKKSRFEAIIEKLKSRASIIWVTHDLEQAARVSDKVLFLKDGRMVECGTCEEIFTKPASSETETFISRRAYA